MLLVSALYFVQAAAAQTVPVASQGIIQSIVVNGQQAEGVMIIQNGTIQSQTCPSPQQYVTTDQSSSGWACFDQTAGTWLLHAIPPRQTTYVNGQPPVYVDAPPVVYGYYGYPYPYYPYPYFVGPAFRFGIGFGFGYRSPFVFARPGLPFRGPGGVVGRPIGHVGVAHVGRR
jgi:hypothetical protein